jgi:uncharacterized protein (DUF924 family)
MPFTHAEDPADQTMRVDLFRRLVDAENPKCAEHHADIVGVFHTATRFAGNTRSDEQSFLTSGGFSG